MPCRIVAATQQLQCHPGSGSSHVALMIPEDSCHHLSCLWHCFQIPLLISLQHVLVIHLDHYQVEDTTT